MERIFYTSCEVKRHKKVFIFCMIWSIINTMSTQIYNVYKPKGLTPLQALELLKKHFRLPDDLKMTYAGRLDPMAEGVLLLLCGKKLKDKDKFLKLPKTYEAEILFGVSTDSFDVLGLILANNITVPDKNLLTQTIKKFVGKILMPIPPYSSVPINGEPSFVHARKGRLTLKNVPERIMEINKIKIFAAKTLTGKKILDNVNKSVKKVTGDFRQKETLKSWAGKFNQKNKYLILRIKVNCASGTYIRSLANSLGQELNTPSLLYNLKRTSVGKYDIKKSIKL